jgi:hypothetical protein
MKKTIYLIIFTLSLVGCGGPKDLNNLGLVTRLPRGEYIIWNSGSRHIVKCQREDGKYYLLNDANFDVNGINGYDAHQYREKTRILIN